MSPYKYDARSCNPLQQAESHAATNCNELRNERERRDKPVHTAYARSAVFSGNTKFSEAAEALAERMGWMVAEATSTGS